jgi:hypothetical protein
MLVSLAAIGSCAIVVTSIIALPSSSPSQVGALEVDASDGDEHLTPLGQHLAQLPVHPRCVYVMLCREVEG